MPTYWTPESRANEAYVAAAVAKAWDVVPVRMPGDFAPIDFRYCFYEGGPTVGYFEVKGRGKTYDTVFLNDNKYRALMGADLPAFFIGRFLPADVILGIEVHDVDASHPSILGRNDRPWDPSAKELIHEIPMEQMRPLSALLGEELQDAA